MPDLSDFLLPQSLLLSLVSEKKERAVEEILELLKEDDRVSNWQELHDSILSRPAFPIPSRGRVATMLYHGRTNSAQDLIIAAGRSTPGIAVEGLEERIHFIFVIAIPNTLNNEYLRVMGAIARVYNDAATLEKLLTTSSPEQFIEILSENNR